MSDGAQGVQLDVPSFINDQPLSKSHYVMVAICVAIMFIDSYDFYVVAKLAPPIAAAFGTTAASMTLTFTMQQIGMAVGAVSIGMLADRYGRKSMLLLCMAAIGVFTFACSFAGSLFQIAVLRGLSGVFIGGVVPSIIAMVSEITPAHARAKMMTISYAGFTIGGAGAAMVAAWLFPLFGWKVAFWIGGLMPLLMLPLIGAFLPESLELRSRRNASDPGIAATLARFFPAVDFARFATLRFPRGSEEGQQVRVRDILRGELKTRTPLIWAVFFFSMGGLLLVTTWLPALFFELAGIPIERYSVLSLYNSFGGVLGIVLVGALLDRWSARIVLPAFCLFNAVFLVMLGAVPFGSAVSLFALLAMGFFQAGTQAGLGAFAAVIYPAHIRGTGIGSAFSAGRIGGIFLPLTGGLLLVMHMPLQTTLILTAVPAIIAAMLLLPLCRKPVALRRLAA